MTINATGYILLAFYVAWQKSRAPTLKKFPAPSKMIF